MVVFMIISSAYCVKMNFMLLQLILFIIIILIILNRENCIYICYNTDRITVFVDNIAIYSYVRMRQTLNPHIYLYIYTRRWCHKINVKRNKIIDPRPKHRISGWIARIPNQHKN